MGCFRVFNIFFVLLPIKKWKKKYIPIKKIKNLWVVNLSPVWNDIGDALLNNEWPQVGIDPLLRRRGKKLKVAA